MTLLEKGIDYEHVEVNYYDRRSDLTKEFLKVSPPGNYNSEKQCISGSHGLAILGCCQI